MKKIMNQISKRRRLKFFVRTRQDPVKLHIFVRTRHFCCVLWICIFFVYLIKIEVTCLV
ncbi:hypothetical protein HanIR_Chr08g0344701 [Helianthus annuus]|nr:hypothetical protein HanIR_Chr08g0344701 [Helianthus annuus]